MRAIAEAEALFAFSDFRLFRLDVARIHWDGGFGSARAIPLAAWREITATITVSDGEG